MGQIVRPPSRGADSVDSGLLSLVEQEQQYNKTRDSPRYNNANVVGIDSSPNENADKSRIDALSDLIASLSSGSDKSSPNSSTSATAWQVLTHP